MCCAAPLPECRAGRDAQTHHVSTYSEDVVQSFASAADAVVEDGVAPMSLMTYQEAFPWGESVRAEVIASTCRHGRESAVRFRNQPTMTSTRLTRSWCGSVAVLRGESAAHAAACSPPQRLGDRA
jgi:hypothetical protein